MRVKIVADGTPRGTKIVDADTGVKLEGAAWVAFQHHAGGLPEAEIGLHLISIEGEAEPCWVVTDPLTGKPRTVRRLEFADGGVLESPERKSDPASRTVVDVTPLGAEWKEWAVGQASRVEEAIANSIANGSGPITRALLSRYGLQSNGRNPRR